jgi:uncharacterized protein YeaO (DUF488 family)
MSAVHPLRIKRAYDSPADSDGTRILVDRIWPRGLTKQRAAVDIWFKDIAPTPKLRTWFGHKPENWQVFREQYFEELQANPTAVQRLQSLASEGALTLLYAARDPAHNHAIVLAEFFASVQSGSILMRETKSSK